MPLKLIINLHDCINAAEAYIRFYKNLIIAIDAFYAKIRIAIAQIQSSYCTTSSSTGCEK